MAKQKNSAKTLFLFVTYTATVVLAGNVFDGLFSFGVYVGALYATNPWFVSVIYLASSIIYGWQNLLQVGVRILVMLFFIVAHRIFKKKISKFNLLFYVICANIFYLVWDYGGYFSLFDKILYTLCGVAFSFVSLYVFRAVFVRGLTYRPALDERVCISIFVMVATFCVSKISFSGMDLAYFFIPFGILFCNVVFDDKTTMVSAVLFGVGNLLAVGSYDCAVFCGISALVTVAFGKISRYLSAVGILAVDVAMSYFLGLHGDFYALVFAPTVASILVFVVIPSGVYSYCNDCVCGNAQRYTSKSVSQKLMRDLSKRLYRLSDIFMSIKNTFYTLSVGKISQGDVVNNIVKQCSLQVCQTCAEKQHCWRNNVSVTDKAFTDLAQSALSRGKCTILDIPQTISVKCDRLAMLISNINSQAQTHKQLVERNEGQQANKLIFAEQMGGVSNLMLALANDYKKSVTFDVAHQTELMETLVFHNVLCVDVAIVTQANVLTVVATVAKTDVDNATIEKCAEIVTKQKMVVSRVEQTDNLRWVNVYLVVKPRFEVTYGVVGVAKQGSQLSADTHSQIVTDNGKNIVALCDGMGSGEKAEQMSSTVIGLVESFYRAGFPSEVILSAVNQLLTQSGNEIFCAVDMVVIDGYNGFADFIKLGASFGLVKCGGNVEIISGSSLPLGVLEEMTPSVTQKVLTTGDMVVLFSDGVADCFNDVHAIAEIFYNTTYTSPQSVAETLMAKTLKKCANQPPDDMTIVVAKVS